jgi:glycosyltransferase involved in cell wall biosynthesis
MRIVLVCDPGHVDGGAAKVAIASARGLAEADMAVDYVCSFGPFAPELSHPNIRLHCLEMDSVWTKSNPVSAAAQGIWNAKARQRLEDILTPLRQEDCVVHFHQWTKSFSPSVLAAPARLGIPAIVSLHDYFLACPNGAYYHFASAKPCALTPLSTACLASSCDRSSSLHKAVRTARQYATARTLEEAGAAISVLSVSPFAERVMDGFIPSHHRRFVVRSPIDIDRQEPVPVADNRQFLFVGRMTEEKGVRQLAAAARATGLPVSFVGDGPLLAEIKALGAPIHCTGWMQPEGVDNMLRQARALVFPSTWYETGGLVVLEALARGIPVLVSRATAPADFVVDGENGFLIDPHDVQNLIARMRDLADPAVAERMGQRAYARYWADPQSLAVHVAKLSTVYRTLLAERQGLPASAA